MSTLKTAAVKHPSSSGTAITLDASDNVGIGTASPTIPLQINGSGTYLAGIESSTAYSFLGLKDSNSSGSISDPQVGVGAQTNDLLFRAGGAERARILSSGGITFNGDTAAANALDDYEEGTWTPAIGSGNGSTSSESGIYTKIGDTVTVSGVFALTGGDSTTQFTFPFAAKAYGGYTNKVKTYSGISNIVFVVSSGTYNVYMQTIDGSSLGTIAGGARFTVTYITG